MLYKMLKKWINVFKLQALPILQLPIAYTGPFKRSRFQADDENTIILLRFNDMDFLINITQILLMKEYNWKRDMFVFHNYMMNYLFDIINNFKKHVYLKEKRK